MPFSSVKAPNLSEAAAAQIRELIALDILSPGDLLPGERDLASRMGISRTSLRSALQALISEGLLISQHGARLRVSETIGSSLADPLVRVLQSAPDTIYDYLNFRIVLEGACAADAAKKATKDDINQLHVIHERLQNALEKGDLILAAEADIEFHMLIVDIAGNVVMIQIARILQDLLKDGIERSHRLGSQDPATWAELIDQHNIILNAIENKDSHEARDAMQAHLEYQKELAKIEKEQKRHKSISGKRRVWAEEQGE